MTELQPGTEFAGHRIEGVAGQGGMGVVYKAQHLALDITVALKVIKPELARDEGFRERFKRESRAAAAIEHPNVLPVRHAGEEDGVLYITMRYVEGTDLRSLIDTRGRLPADRAVSIIGDIADALDAAHARGLVHRDVKPANVLLEGADGSGHAYLTDFGLTRHTSSSSEAGLTKTGQWVGTLDYVAPEQIEGRSTDARADVYALGCVLYEMLTGHVPFAKDSEVATMYAHMNEAAPPPRESVPDLPSEIDAVIARALAKDPDDRYPSAGDLAAAAIAAVRGRPVAQPEKSVAAGEAAPAAAGADAAGVGETVTSGSTPAAETTAGSPAPTAAGAAPPTAGATAPPTRDAEGRPPPPPPPPPPQPKGGGAGNRRAIFAGVGALALLALIVGGLFAAGVIGGDDGPSPEEQAAEETAAEEEEAAEQEAAAEETVTEFREAFSTEGLSTIETLLAPDTNYGYLGFEDKPAVDEYRDLFAALNPKDYQLTVDEATFEAGSSPPAVEATLSYEYVTSRDNRASGVLEWRLERETEEGDYRIAEIYARPDLYSYFTIVDPPTEYDVDLFAGPGELVGQTSGTLQAEGDGVPIRIPIDESAAPDLNGSETLRSVATFRESAGKSTDTTKLDYPYAS